MVKVQFDWPAMTADVFVAVRELPPTLSYPNAFRDELEVEVSVIDCSLVYKIQ